MPVTVLGVGSNVIVRDGGIRGVVIRLLRGFTGITVEGHEVVAGAGAPDLNVALTAREHSLAGLEFLSGIPGTIGGAFPTNAGAYGGELAEVLISAEAVDRAGRVFTVTPGELGLSYRHSKAPADWIFTSARLRAAPGDQLAITRRINEIDTARADSQPRSRTGGSTFANPPGHKAWELIDARRLPWAEDRRRAGLREAHQFPDQSRRCHRFRHREAGRGSAPARVRQERRAARMGDPPPRRVPMSRKVAVLMGGWSPEREVSLVSGKACAEGLREGGHQVIEYDVKRDLRALIEFLRPASGGGPDVVFNALHGKYGEDGCIQGVLEVLAVPYTHSGVLASAIAMDKPMARHVFTSLGMRVADGKVIERRSLAWPAIPCRDPMSSSRSTRAPASACTSCARATISLPSSSRRRSSAIASWSRSSCRVASSPSR